MSEEPGTLERAVEATLFAAETPMGIDALSAHLGGLAPGGRRGVPGRPVIYATTPDFLDHFGLASRRDLPGIDELRAAGLLDPVDEAMESALGDMGRFEPDEAHDGGAAEDGSGNDDDERHT